MKKSVYSPAIILFSFLFFSPVLSAQLSEQQKTAINTYIKTTPALSKYGNAIKEKVLMDEEVIVNIKNCWPQLKKYAEKR